MGLVHDHPHTWPAPLQPLEHAEFRLLWTGTLISNAGSWMQRVATAWLVYSMTGSTAWLGVESFAAGIPAVLLLPIGGVLSDRLNRRTVLIVSNLVNAIVAALLAAGWWSGVLQVWHIVAASFISGIVSSVMVPASQSVLPVIAGDDHLAGAVALNSVQYNVARALGPALGGMALIWGGPGWCFIFNALSFFALIGAFLAIRSIPKPSRTEQSILSGLREGSQFLRQRSDLMRMLLLVGLLAFCSAPVVSMLPALSKEVLHRAAAGYSVLLTAFGVGAAVAGVLLILKPAIKHRLRIVHPAALFMGTCLALLGWTPSMEGAVVLAGLAGCCFVGAMIELGTGLLQYTPDDFRGRVSSVQQMIFRAAQPLGGLIAGLVATHVHLPLTFTAFGLVLAAVAGTLWFHAAGAKSR